MCVILWPLMYTTRVRRYGAPPQKCVGVCVAVFCSMLQCVAVCYSVLQCVAVCCSVLQCAAMRWRNPQMCCSVFAVCCSVVQCVAVRRSVLQCAGEIHRWGFLRIYRALLWKCVALLWSHV